VEISSKKQLGIVLSQLQGFEVPKVKLEQYPTEPDIAAEIAWVAFYRREIEEKTCADLGCGTGLLGISLLLLGAKKVFLVDKDEDAIKIAKENIKIVEEKFEIDLSKKAIFIIADVTKGDFLDEKVDLVIQNPPFGIQGKTHADKAFLEQAFKITDLIYSFHKSESSNFLGAVSKDNGFKIEGFWEFNWPLKQTMKHHKKKIQYIKVGCWRLEKA
jgi:putative methylase